MIYAGNTVQLVSTFLDMDNEPVNPSTITLKVRGPNGAVQTYTGGQLTGDEETGTWSMLYVPLTPGHYDVRWETLNPACANEIFFDVKPGRF